MGKRVFFPRDVENAEGVPFLQAVARKLVELAAKDGVKTLVMSRFVCVLPGRRAIRTLDAYLTETVHEGIREGRFDSDWTPPVFLQMGETPEKLYDQTALEANTLTRLYCERRALQTFLTAPQYRQSALELFPSQRGKNEKKESDEESAKRLRALVANPQGAIKLAQTFLSLDQKLADERKSAKDVADVCEKRGLNSEMRRWVGIGKLRQLYLKELASLPDDYKRVDRNAERERALSSGLIGSSNFDVVDGERREYFVVGAVDLDRQQKDVFLALGDRVQYWVYAPIDAVNGAPKTEFDVYFENNLESFFDEFGCVVPERWDPELWKTTPQPQGALPFALPIPEENVFQVESPEEQGKAVALLTRELSRKDMLESSTSTDKYYDPIAPEQLTIGAPDSEVVPFIEESMKELGYATIHGEGSPATQNRVYRTLELFADYLETRSYDTLGEILRRPDVERWLCRVWNDYPFASSQDDAAEKQENAKQRELDEAQQAEDDERMAEEAESGGDVQETAASATPYRELWLRDFDDYRETFLPTRVDKYWFTSIDEDSPNHNRYFVNLRHASEIIDANLKDFFEEDRSYVYNNAPKARERSGVDAENDDLDALKIGESDFDLSKLQLTDVVSYTTRQVKRSLNEWTDPITKLASQIYGGKIVNRDEYAQIHGLFSFLNRGLDVLHRVPEFEKDDDVSGSYAIRSLLNELGGKSVPPPPGSKVVEIQGWLDLLFDDAPYCILTSFNEGVVPSTQSGDLFLPNEMRKQLGLSDASRVFARDAYLAYTLARSRAAFFVVLERRSLQNDPRLPSRLLFAADDETIPERVVKYFGSHGGDAYNRLEHRHADRVFPLHAPESEEAVPTHKGFRVPVLHVSNVVVDEDAVEQRERANNSEKSFHGKTFIRVGSEYLLDQKDKFFNGVKYHFSATLDDVQRLYQTWEISLKDVNVERFVSEFLHAGKSVANPGEKPDRILYRGCVFEWKENFRRYILTVLDKINTKKAGSDVNHQVELPAIVYLYSAYPQNADAFDKFLRGDEIPTDDILGRLDNWKASNLPYQELWTDLLDNIEWRSLPYQDENDEIEPEYIESSAPKSFPEKFFVTDFQTFLNSPYRFFLRKHFKLSPETNDANELNAANFGNIAHDVLRLFGRDESIRDATDEYAIFNWLSKKLDERAALAFNNYTSPFVPVQIEEIRSRLRSFAAWQARWRKTGRKIKFVEEDATIRVGELGFVPKNASPRVNSAEIYGRIDRIDYYERENRWYVFDYKTFDKASAGGKKKKDDPGDFEEVVAQGLDDTVLLSTRTGNVVDAKHRARMDSGQALPMSFAAKYRVPEIDELSDRRWINLQLPLYRHFLRKIVDDPNPQGSLGYIVLTPSDVQAYGAPWTRHDLMYADATCRWVVDSIWRLFRDHIVDPKDFVDDGFLPILDQEKRLFDDFAPITLSYLD